MHTMRRAGTVRHLPPEQVAAGVGGGPEPSIVITSPRVDREKDRAIPERLRLAADLPVLFGHDHRDLPVGKMTRTVLEPGGKRRAWWRWLEHDDRAGRVRNAFEQGMLSASIGALVDWREPNEYGGVDFGGEVIEFSLVAIPANPDCRRFLESVGLWEREAPSGSLGRGDGQELITLPDVTEADWQHLLRRARRDAARAHGIHAGPLDRGDYIEISEVFDVDKAWLRAVCEQLGRDVYRDVIRPAIVAQIVRAVRLARGRVD